MSYNIDTWKTKKLVDLRIPLKAFFKHPRTDWHPEKEFQEDNHLTLRFMNSKISGKLKDEILFVEEMKISGEGSGTEMDWTIEPALQESTGELIASCIWERGDMINQLRVKDGSIEWVGIEI